jgi:hypothetical protein
MRILMFSLRARVDCRCDAIFGRLGVGKSSVQILIWMCIFNAARSLQLDQGDLELLETKKKAIAAVLIPDTENAHMSMSFQNAIATSSLTTLVGVLKSVSQVLQQAVISSDITNTCLGKIEALFAELQTQQQVPNNDMAAVVSYLLG